MKLKAYAVEWVENVKDMDVLIEQGWELVCEAKARFIFRKKL